MSASTWVSLRQSWPEGAKRAPHTAGIFLEACEIGKCWAAVNNAPASVCGIFGIFQGAGQFAQLVRRVDGDADGA